MFTHLTHPTNMSAHSHNIILYISASANINYELFACAPRGLVCIVKVPSAVHLIFANGRIAPTNSNKQPDVQGMHTDGTSVLHSKASVCVCLRSQNNTERKIRYVYVFERQAFTLIIHTAFGLFVIRLRYAHRLNNLRVYVPIRWRTLIVVVVI